MLCHDLRVQSKHYFDSVAWENIAGTLFMVYFFCAQTTIVSAFLAIAAVATNGEASTLTTDDFLIRLQYWGL